MRRDLQKIAVQWLAISNDISVPHTDAEYDRLVELLDKLIDEVGDEESHPLASLMEIVGVLIEHYENENISEFE